MPGIDEDDQVFGHVSSNSRCLKVAKDTRDAVKLHDRVHSRRGSRDITLWVIIFLLIAGSASGTGWYFYSRFPRSVQVSIEIPVLLAPPEAIKGTPDQDKRLYQRRGGKDFLPKGPAGLDSSRDTPMIVIPVVPTPAPIISVISPTIPSGFILWTDEQVAFLHRNIFKRRIMENTVHSVPVPQLAAPAALLSHARLQLGSFKDTGDAERAWVQLRHRHGDLLSGIQHIIVPVNLGVKGTWYRVYAGPYDDIQRALLVCKALHERSTGCLLALQ
ncbi:hypothetical protein RIEGSTA812A_PEG_56 [invertebrate metagenome]|uniref:SPOR domain-containing protein n=1 Tax=invertebrate metagenome TaxID=1711999 RepID=A0A484H784_9ZZZZ